MTYDQEQAGAIQLARKCLPILLRRGLWGLLAMAIGAATFVVSLALYATQQAARILPTERWYIGRPPYSPSSGRWGVCVLRREDASPGDVQISDSVIGAPAMCRAYCLLLRQRHGFRRYPRRDARRPACRLYGVKRLRA